MSGTRKSNIKKLNAVIWVCATVLTLLIVFSAMVLVARLTDNIPESYNIILLIPDEPNLTVGDGQDGWGTDNKIEIFKSEYSSEGGSATITSSTDGAVFAPGATTSYTFKLQNNGNVAIDYNVQIDFGFLKGNEDFDIEKSPLLVRLYRKDGNVYIVGDKDNFVPVANLGTYEDGGTLGINSYNEYELEIHWLFESGDDTHDTWLANLPSDESVSFTADVNTLATQNPDRNATGGILDPNPAYTVKKVGGSVNVVPLIVLVALAVGYASTLTAAAIVRKNKKPKG